MNPYESASIEDNLQHLWWQFLNAFWCLSLDFAAKGTSKSSTNSPNFPPVLGLINLGPAAPGRSACFRVNEVLLSPARFEDHQQTSPEVFQIYFSMAEFHGIFEIVKAQTPNPDPHSSWRHHSVNSIPLQLIFERALAKIHRHHPETILEVTAITITTWTSCRTSCGCCHAESSGTKYEQIMRHRFYKYY